MISTLALSVSTTAQALEGGSLAPSLSLGEDWPEVMPPVGDAEAIGDWIGSYGFRTADRGVEEGYAVCN